MFSDVVLHEFDLAHVDGLAAPVGEVIRLGQIDVALGLHDRAVTLVAADDHPAPAEIVGHDRDALRDVDPLDELAETRVDFPFHVEEHGSVEVAPP